MFVCVLLLLQVVVLSSGHTMYSGTPSLIVPWLSGELGYAYNPERHGSAPDWSMDLVNVGFKKAKVMRQGDDDRVNHLRLLSLLTSAKDTHTHEQLITIQQHT